MLGYFSLRYPLKCAPAEIDLNVIGKLSLSFKMLAYFRMRYPSTSALAGNTGPHTNWIDRFNFLRIMDLGDRRNCCEACPHCLVVAVFHFSILFSIIASSAWPLYFKYQAVSASVWSRNVDLIRHLLSRLTVEKWIFFTLTLTLEQQARISVDGPTTSDDKMML